MSVSFEAPVPRQPDEQLMRLALEQAEQAARHGDVPIGAVITGPDGSVIGAAGNERELQQDPTAHAEVLVLRQAATALGSWRLLDCTLYVTLEPCAMCAGAIVLSRIPRVVFGTLDPKAGACGSTVSLLDDPRFNHRPEVTGGILADECATVLREFFSSRR